MNVTIKIVLSEHLGEKVLKRGKMICMNSFLCWVGQENFEDEMIVYIGGEGNDIITLKANVNKPLQLRLPHALSPRSNQNMPESVPLKNDLLFRAIRGALSSLHPKETCSQDEQARKSSALQYG